MNNFEEKISLKTRGASEIGRAADVAFAKQAAKVGDRSPEFSMFSRGRAQMNSAELLRQGALIVSFLAGLW